MAKMPSQIVFASGKGGVGKTTITASVLKLLLDEKPSMVALDADAEAPNLHILLGVDSWDEERRVSTGRIAQVDLDSCIKCGACAEACQFNAIKLLDDGTPVISKLFCEGCQTCSLVCPVNSISLVEDEGGLFRFKDNLFGKLALISLSNLIGRPGSGKLVYEGKNFALRLALEREVDWLLVDAPAGIGCQVVAALNGAKYVVLVMEPTPTSLHDADRLLKVARNFRAEVFGVINRAEDKPEVLEQIDRIKAWMESNGVYLLGMIPFSSEIPKLSSYGKTLLEAQDTTLKESAIEIYHKLKESLE